MRLHIRYNVNQKRGFTLIEVIVVVAIIGILAAIAIPSYQNSVARARRADATAALLGLASAMERRFTENNSYCDNGTLVQANCGDSGGDTGAPAFYAGTVPVDGSGTAYYTLEIEKVDEMSFTIKAKRAGPMANDACGDFTLTQTGKQDQVDHSQTESCW